MKGAPSTSETAHRRSPVPMLEASVCPRGRALAAVATAMRAFSTTLAAHSALMKRVGCSDALLPTARDEG